MAEKDFEILEEALIVTRGGSSGWESAYHEVVKRREEIAIALEEAQKTIDALNSKLEEQIERTEAAESRISTSELKVEIFKKQAERHAEERRKVEVEIDKFNRTGEIPTPRRSKTDNLLKIAKSILKNYELSEEDQLTLRAAIADYEFRVV